MDGVALIADDDAGASTGGAGETGNALSLGALGDRGVARLDEEATQLDAGKNDMDIVDMEEEAWATGDVDELSLALNRLPQRMADLEELALGGMYHEVSQGELRFVLRCFSCLLLFHSLPQHLVPAGKMVNRKSRFLLHYVLDERVGGGFSSVFFGTFGGSIAWPTRVQNVSFPSPSLLVLQLVLKMIVAVTSSSSLSPSPLVLRLFAHALEKTVNHPTTNWTGNQRRIQAGALAEECCTIMAVITTKLRMLAATLPSSSSCSPSSPASSPAAPAPAAGILRKQRSRLRLAAAKRHVRQLASAASPATTAASGNDRGVANLGTTTDEGLCSSFPGLSLARVVMLSEKRRHDSQRAVLRSSQTSASSRCDDFRGIGPSVALLETCAAFHIHLLEWLHLTDGDADGCVGGVRAPEKDGADPVGASSHADSGGFACGG